MCLLPILPVNYEKYCWTPPYGHFVTIALFVLVRHSWHSLCGLRSPCYTAYGHPGDYSQILKCQPECMILYNFMPLMQPLIPLIFIFPFLAVYTLIQVWFFITSTFWMLIKEQVWVVGKVDYAIHQTSHYPADSRFVLLTLIHWIEIYLVDSSMNRPWNNWGQLFRCAVVIYHSI